MYTIAYAELVELADTQDLGPCDIYIYANGIQYMEDGDEDTRWVYHVYELFLDEDNYIQCKCDKRRLAKAMTDWVDTNKTINYHFVKQVSEDYVISQ